MVGRAPTQGILWLSDELAGFFKSANQYRNGRGSDQEDLLECWSGNGAVIARATGTTVNVGAVSLSIYGNIQPKVLAPFLGDGSDNNGTFARFDFVQQPRALTQITLGLPKIDANPMLQALYERVDAIPLMQFELDQEAKELFADYYNHCQRLRFDHPKQGMRAMLGKAAEKVGRVATILHCIHAAHFGAEVSQKIPASRVRAAIKWVEYTTQQALSINIEVCSPDALESNLAKIISLAERKGGTATVRDIQQSFDSKYGFTAQKIREWLQKLVEMNYGEVTQKGNSIRFSLTKSSTPSTVVQNPNLARLLGVEDCIYSTSTPSTSSTPTAQETTVLEATVEDCRGTVEANPLHLKPSPDIELKPTVESVEDFLHFPENSDSLMLSHTTEPAQFTDEALASTLADEMRQAIAKGSYENAKEVMKQVSASAPQVRQFFFKSFSKEESLNIRLLKNFGLTKGTRVKYVGNIEQYAGEVLTVESLNSQNELACLRPEGKGYTTWLKSEDLRKL